MVENCTPGDWHTTGHPEGMEFEILAGELYVGAASWGVDGIDDAPTFSQARANAHMFAASKRMYEALEAAEEAAALSIACQDMDTIPKHIMDQADTLFRRAQNLRLRALSAARGEQS